MTSATETEQDKTTSTKYVVLARKMNGEGQAVSGWYEIGEHEGTKSKVIEAVVEGYAGTVGGSDVGQEGLELKGCEFRAVAASSWGIVYETYTGVRPQK